MNADFYFMHCIVNNNIMDRFSKIKIKSNDISIDKT